MKDSEFTLEAIKRLFLLPPIIEVLDSSPEAFLITFKIGSSSYLELFTKDMFCAEYHFSMSLGYILEGRIRTIGATNLLQREKKVSPSEFIEVTKQHFDTTPLLFHTNSEIRDFFKKAV